MHKVSSLDRNYLVVYRVNGHFRAFNYLMEVLHIFDRQDLFHLYDLVMKQYSEITPEDIELILWGDLKIMMESSTEENDQGDFWNNQQEWEIVRWRLYEACGVCILELKDGTVIYMLVERRYPLSKELLQQMIDLGLEVEEESTAALQLDQTVPVQKQTAFGKDKSNPLIVDSLLKTIRLSIHLVVYNEDLAIPEQTTTDKGISSSLMAGSLPKTTKPTYSGLLPRRKWLMGEVQLQALIDKRRSYKLKQLYVRRGLSTWNADGVDCLPNAIIFEHLTLIGYEKLSQKLTFYKAFFSPQWKFLIHTILQCLSAKTTTWNEFSSTMASAIIYLATNQKFNFSKYIFESMVKNLDNAVKFLMYPRIIQVFLNNQLEGMETHNRIYIAPSHTKNIFANMRRKGKDFSGRETPLFPTMMVQAQEEIGEGSAMPTDPHHTPIITQPSSS
ncbi:hypothetical protein Tco_0490035 [Tanacetum coccineum]